MTEHNDRYGWPHRRERARVKRDVDAGLAVCRRCHEPIHPLEPWDLDHVDQGGVRDYLGASHRRCNRASLTHARGESNGSARERLFPDDGNTVPRWSRHWYGGFNTRCPACRELGEACPDARAEASA